MSQRTKPTAPVSTSRCDVTMGIPVAAAAYPTTERETSTVAAAAFPATEHESALSAHADTYLSSLGLPIGVRREFQRTLEAFPSRTWIIDNSGSMATNDGHRLVATTGAKCHREVSSTRWDELGDAILWHGSLAAHIGAKTEFRLLNPPGMGQPQVLTCGVQAPGRAQDDVEKLKRLVNTSPTGRTPLCAQIREVAAQVSANADKLRQQGQRHVVVIASDGMSTDGDVAEAMRPLQALPVWVVVRLCTDDDQVVQYWNKVDEELELDLDVLDDLTGEAKEVCSFSPWLNYGMPLHRLREWGCMNKLFDLLDEKALSHSEMRELLVLLLGEEDLPHPQVNFPAAGGDP